jgi:membrane-bound serine protease (ClpP class)
VLAALALWGAATPVAGAQGTPPPAPPAEPPAAPPPVDVIEVSGRIDAIEADFVARSVAAAERGGSQFLVVQLNSPGAVLSGQELDELAFRITHAGVPVAVWVGPSGARAYGGAVRLVQAAAVSGMATGTRVGRFRYECRLCPPGDPLLTRRTLSASAARNRLAVDTVAPTLGDFIVEQNGREVGGRQLETARVVVRNGQPRREPIAQVRFAKLSLMERVLHATTSPQLAFLLLVLGLLLIVFEFYSVGVGLAGLTGAGCLVLAAYGLAALGASPLGLGLIGLAVFGLAVDVQAGAPRTWTVIGGVALVWGSRILFEGDRRVGWVAMVLVALGTLLFMLRGMPSMIRARFSTATIGREALVGEKAEATTAIDPEGMVRLRGALWRARVNRATPIVAGQGVKVVALDGLVLEVQPQTEPPPAAGSEAG